MVKVTVECNPPVEDFPLSVLRAGEVGILTHSEGISSPGDPVFGCSKEACLPKLDSWVDKASMYRFRYLQPGEKIIIEGQ